MEFVVIADPEPIKPYEEPIPYEEPVVHEAYDTLKESYNVLYPAFQFDHLTFYEIFELNIYNVLPEEIEGKNVLDIGSNVGYFSWFCSQFNPKKLIAVEPCLQNPYCSLLELKGIQLVKKIVLDKDGESRKIYILDSICDSNIYSEACEKYETVETITLDTLLKEFDGKVVVKFDCEGAEYDILMNVSQETMDKISFIYIEIHPTLNPIYKGKNMIKEKLISFGFREIYTSKVYNVNNPEISKWSK